MSCETCGEPIGESGSYLYCARCIPLKPEYVAEEQINDALRWLDAPPESFLRWPFDDLDRVYGGMAKGSVHMACAFSGGGKTSFLASCTNRWLDQGKRVYVLPLETTPDAFRTYLAAERLGIPAGLVFSGDVHLESNGEARLDAIRGELRSQTAGEMSRRLVVSPAEEIDLRRFQRAAREAAEHGADVVIVDHVDHIAGGDGSDLYAESVRVVKRSLSIAKDLRLRFVLASQLNLQATHGDKLAKYQPPQAQHLYMGSHKLHISSGIIGLFRKIRDRRQDEPKSDDPKEDRYLALLRRARSGEVEPSEVLEPNTMGVVLIKSRNFGQREGTRVYLHYASGRVQNKIRLAGATA